MGPPRRKIALLEDPDRLADAYASSTIAELAARMGVSDATVRRALIRHGIDRLPRNRNRRPTMAQVLDDADWLRRRYRTHSAVDIAAELGASSRTVYAAMDRHRIARRTEPGMLRLRRPQLGDNDWLRDAVERSSSTRIAAELQVSPGTVTPAYRRSGVDPGSTALFYASGRPRRRPPEAALLEAWAAEGTFRGVARRIGTTHPTAAVWLAEIGVFADTSPKLSRSDLLAAIARRCQWWKSPQHTTSA